MASKVLLGLLLCGVMIQIIDAHVQGRHQDVVHIRDDYDDCEHCDKISCSISSIDVGHSHHEYKRYVAHPSQFKKNDVDWEHHPDIHTFEECAHAASDAHHSMFFFDDHYKCDTSKYHYIVMEEECHPEHGKVVYILHGHDTAVDTSHHYCIYDDIKIYNGEAHHVKDIGCGSPGDIYCSDGHITKYISMMNGQKMLYTPEAVGYSSSGCIFDEGNHYSDERDDICHKHGAKPCYPYQESYTETFFSEVHTYMTSHNLDNFVMGLSYNSVTTKWEWSNGYYAYESGPHSHWDEHYPTHDDHYCTVMHHDYLHNVDCHGQKYHTCCMVPHDHHH